MKETGTTHWLSPNTGATNSSGFTGLPGGTRFNSGTFFSGGGGYWWSSTEKSADIAIGRVLNYDNDDVNLLNTNKGNGVSVRCLRD